MASPVFHGLAGAGLAYAMAGDVRLPLFPSLRKSLPLLFAAAFTRVGSHLANRIPAPAGRDAAPSASGAVTPKERLDAARRRAMIGP